MIFLDIVGLTVLLGCERDGKFDKELKNPSFVYVNMNWQGRFCDIQIVWLL